MFSGLTNFQTAPSTTTTTTTTTTITTFTEQQQQQKPLSAQQLKPTLRMSTFQTISPSRNSQFITSSCKDCLCVDFQVSSNKYQWRDQYILDNEQVCWECKHKALSHRWGQGVSSSSSFSFGDELTNYFAFFSRRLISRLIRCL